MSRFDAVLALIAETFESDDIGQQVAVRSRRVVYANTFNLTSAEFYEAAAQGLRASRRYQLRAVDYEDEQFVDVDGVEYTVIRVDRRGEWVTLTLERKAANRG